MWNFRSTAISTRITIVFDKGSHSRPGILAPDEVQYLVLSEVSQDWIMLVPENLQLKIRNIGNIDPIVEVK